MGVATHESRFDPLFIPSEAAYSRWLLWMLKVARTIPGCGWAPMYTMHEGLKGYCPWGCGGATIHLDLPSLTPLSVVGCGRLKPGVSYWATSVDYCKSLIIDSSFCGSRFSTGTHQVIEDFKYLYLLSSCYHPDMQIRKVKSITMWCSSCDTLFMLNYILIIFCW